MPGFVQAWKVPYLNMEGFLEKSLKIKSAMKNTGKLSLDDINLEKSLNLP